MKNLKYLIVFILLLSSGLTFKVLAQNSLTQVPSTPFGPYAGGTLITVPYSMEFTMLTGNKAELNISFPTTLDFVSSDLTTSGIWTLTSSIGANPVTYQTITPFTANDNNYTSATDFTLTFRVNSGSCLLLSDNIITTLSTLTGSSSTDQVAVSTNIKIFNSAGTGISATMNLIQGDECSTAMYEIKSFGLDVSTANNSTFDLTVPAGATLQGVFNTIGNPISFTPSGSGPTTYSWSRSGFSNEQSQTHYVIIAYDQSILCQSSSDQLGLIFNSHNVCDPSASISTTINPLDIIPCCNQPPNTMNGVVLRKSLIKYPLRYFPAPDNCKTHDYIIKVDNLTPNDLNNFVLNDFLDDIVPSFPGEIEVTQITATLNSIIPSSSFSFNSSLGGNNSSSILLSSSPPTILFSSSSGPYFNSNFNITGSTVFPKYSSLTIKITHRLGIDPSPTPYINKAQLDFKIGSNPYSGSVNFQSVKDDFIPAITIEKKVKNVTDGGPFSSGVSANPGDALTFEIKIKNYGMKEVTGVNLADLIAESFPNGTSASNFTLPTSFSVTGIDYTIPELSAIQTGGISSSGFARIFTIKAAPCNGYTELKITYQTNVNQNVTCNSIYTNTATLTYNFNGNHTISSSAVVNVDLFKNIAFKLEASCKGPDGPWTINNINGIPGQPIWYKASLKNNNNYVVSDLKMMVQLPSQPSLISNHPIGLDLVSTAPLTPTGTNLQPLLVSGAGSITGSAQNNWLNTSATLPTTPLGNIALYKEIPPLGSGAETSIIYQVMVPINTFTPVSQYKTALGVSRSSSSGCPIVKQTDLTLTIASSNACGSISGCDLILFDSKVERDLSNLMNFNVTLSNMLNNYSGFNVNNFDIVVHQPYSDIVTTSPYIRYMIGYKLDAISSVNPPFTFLSLPVGGRRYHKVYSSVPTLNFGDVNFNIISTNLSPVSTKLTFPINLTFRDKSNPCTICERTIYLNYKLVQDPWNQLIQNDMLKSEKDTVNLSLNEARQRLRKSPDGAKIEQWYETLKKNDGIGKMLLNHPSDVIELFKIARKMIENGGVLEQKDFDLIEKNMQILNEISPAPNGLINDSLKQLKATIGQKWSLSIFDRWGNGK